MAHPRVPYEEWKKLSDAYDRLGDLNAASRELGLDINTGRSRYNAGKARWGGIPKDSPVAPGPAVPEGFQVKGVSTLYNADGEVTAQWVKTSADAAKQEEAFRAAIEGLKDELPRCGPVTGPDTSASALMVCYPIGDHHLGLLSWHEETGADYDLSIAEDLLARVSESLISAAPSCGQAVVAILGDYLHYDSHQPLTPTNRNLLDSDTRFPKMVRAAMRSVRRMVNAALARHAKVLIIIEIGNHDLASSIWLMEALSVIYENEPRVTVDTSPSHFHYFRFGKCLLGTHHGDGVKMEKLPLIMATDRPEDWGQTEYRYWLTGHIHHDQVKDIEGCKVESVRILAPADAWATNKGYRSARDMKAIVYHKDYGEVARHIVNPAMVS